MEIRVYYEDTDAGGIVYHTNYLKFCERARSEIFFERGLKPFDEESAGFVVKSLKADFLGSARLGDVLKVTTEVIKLNRASLELEQKIFLKDKAIFEMRVTLAYVKNLKVAKIPEEFLELFS